MASVGALATQKPSSGSTTVTTVTTMTSTTSTTSATNEMSKINPSGVTTIMTTCTENTQDHPFKEINEPFQQAAADSEERKWCFPKGDIAIDKFIASITSFLNIFDALGSNVITDIVRKDFRWKMNGLRNSARRLRAESVRQVVRNELKSPPRFWAPSGIESLLWSHRILRFVDTLVEALACDATLELREACVKAYRATLAVRHPQMTRLIFEKALNLVPPRAQFNANLMKIKAPSEADRALCLVGMKEFLRCTRPVIEALGTLFDMEEIDDSVR